MDITEILSCPECRGRIHKNLQCETCGKQYSIKHGVYFLISLKLSSEQEYLYRKKIPDNPDELFSQEEEEQLDKLIQTYYALFNQETNDAIKKRDAYVRALLNTISGDVCDLATGRGTMLQKVIDSGKAANIICTDINEFGLMRTRVRRNGRHTNIFYVATDGRYLSFQDKSFDYITSLAGFGNIPDTDKVARELYRILKPNGKMIIEGGYIEKNSRSYTLAESAGVARGMVEEDVIEDLAAAGFVNITSTVVAEAVWAENPYDLLPAAGDRQRYCVIQAERAR